MTLQGYFKVLNIIIFVILTALAIYLSEEILVQYAAKDTSFSQSEIKVTEEDSPTFVFAFWPLKVMHYPENVPYMAYEQWELGKDFEVNFGIVEDYYNDVERISLDLNNDSLKLSHDDIGKVNFTKLLTKYGLYYKVSANLINVKYPYMAFVEIDFINGLPDDQLPDIELALSTEAASYGCTMYDWLDGERIQLVPVNGFQAVEITPHRIIKMNNCNEHQMFYECYEKALQAQDYTHCPRKCSAVSIRVSNSITIIESSIIDYF